MEAKVEQYLREERGVSSEIVRRKLREKVMKYDDIAREFEQWLERREYEDGVEIMGYTARRVSELTSHLDGIGVFNFLVTLRDNPDEARDIIEDGFKLR